MEEFFMFVVNGFKKKYRMWRLLIKILKSVVWIRTLIRPGKGYLVKKILQLNSAAPFFQCFGSGSGLDPD
jgi:hypothetical protein